MDDDTANLDVPPKTPLSRSPSTSSSDRLPWLGGKIAGLRRDYGVATLIDSFCCTILCPYLDGSPTILDPGSDATAL